MTFNPQEIPKLDYEKTLAAIDKYDGHVQEIKNWSITACGAVLLLGLKNNSVSIASLSIFIAIGFCFAALICKTFLIAAWTHAKELETLIRSNRPELESCYRFGLVQAGPQLTVKALVQTSIHAIGWHVPLFFGLIIVVTVIADVYILCFR